MMNLNVNIKLWAELQERLRELNVPLNPMQRISMDINEAVLVTMDLPDRRPIVKLFPPHAKWLYVKGCLEISSL